MSKYGVAGSHSSSLNTITRLLPSGILKALLNSFWHLRGGFMYEWCSSSNNIHNPFPVLGCRCVEPELKKRTRIATAWLVVEFFSVYCYHCELVIFSERCRSWTCLLVQPFKISPTNTNRPKATIRRRWHNWLKVVRPHGLLAQSGRVELPKRFYAVSMYTRYYHL